ncbi:hypothetical protein QO003_000910 [Arthrobacter silviterrae]|uniref:Uncharacterized protein n=1 Tax=Arthrobacter silviterrae TaxID=2026658 RepID=A0ABX0DD43_9MICC|nr:hypothetical protein [Arthrobacter silviterrae]MDQ0276607.1 hypothetical protein [Arthrobacter silviterrae]NGN84548.1 hypothetical protein [Arthrobacter silviterrae]
MPAQNPGKPDSHFIESGSHFSVRNLTHETVPIHAAEDARLAANCPFIMEVGAPLPQQNITKLLVSQWQLTTWQAGPKPQPEQREWLRHNSLLFTTSGMPPAMPTNLQTASK